MHRIASLVGLGVVILAGWALPANAQHKAHPTHSAHEQQHEHELGVPEDESFEEYAKRVWNRDKLTGDWMGFRTDAKDHGLDVQFTLSQFYQGVASGGVDKNSEYGGKLNLRVTVDANKLLGTWKGLYFSAHVETQFGEGILEDTGGFVLENAAMLYPTVGSKRTEITGYLLEQYLNKNLAVFAGKLNALDLWTAFYPKDVSYGLDGFWNLNSMATGFPWLRYVNLAMWGGGGWTITDDGQIQAALLVFDVDSAATSNSITNVFGDGVAGLAVYKFFYDIFEMPGSLLLAVGGSTAEYGSLDPHDWGVVPGEGLTNDDKRGTGTGGGYLRQVFWQAEDDKDRSAWLLMGASVSSGNPSFAKWNVFVTLNSVGLFSSRPKDRMGVSWWFTGLSNNFTDLTRDVGFPTRDTYGVEIFYNIQLNPWLHLTPDLQIVRNENKGDNTAIIPGVRMVIDF
jgi:porin